MKQKNSLIKKLVVFFIIIVLVIGWNSVNAYIYSHRSYVGKGPQDTFFESFLYSLSLLTAITELGILSFTGKIFKIFFFYASIANVLFFILCLYVGTSTHGFGFDTHDPLAYLTYLPLLCNGVLFLIFLIRKQ